MGIEDRWTQIGEEPEAGTDTQQAALRSLGELEGLPLGTADGTQQDRVRGMGGGQGLGRHRVAGLVVGHTTQQSVLQLDRHLTAGVQGLDELDRLGDDLGTDAVTREHKNLF